MKQAKNNSIMLKILLKWSIKKASIVFYEVAKQQIIIKKHKAKGCYTWQWQRGNEFSVRKELPKDLESKRTVASFAATLWFTIYPFLITGPCEGVHSAN